MYLKLILFAIVAVVAAFPEPERERRGILAAPALAAPAWVAAPKIAAAPVAIAAPAAKLLAARKYLRFLSIKKNMNIVYNRQYDRFV